MNSVKSEGAQQTALHFFLLLKQRDLLYFVNKLVQNILPRESENE